MELRHKVALVTGGNRNNGRETALALAERGADVVITYRERREQAEQTLRELEGYGGRATVLQLDLSTTDQLDTFVAALKKVLNEWEHSKLDILVNNAGMLRMATFDQVTEHDLDIIYKVNYKSVFFLTQRLSPLLAEGGRIINIGSATAHIAFAPLVSYGPLKAALQSLTVYLASFLGQRGITVNAVAPGGLDNEFNAGLFERMPQARDYIRSNTALGRIGSSQDVGGIIAFLCTDAASFISGAVIPVDGGYHL